MSAAFEPTAGSAARVARAVEVRDLYGNPIRLGRREVVTVREAAAFGLWFVSARGRTVTLHASELVPA